MLQGAPAPVISEEDAQRYADLGNEVQLAPTDLIAGQYYLRVRVCDQAGVLAQVTQVFAAHSIGVATVNQRSQKDGSAYYVDHTSSNESSLAALKAELKSMDCVLEPVVSFRILSLQQPCSLMPESTGCEVLPAGELTIG